MSQKKSSAKKTSTPTQKVNPAPTQKNAANPTSKVEAKPAVKVEAKPAPKVEAKPTTNSSGIMTITLDEENIRKTAYEYSTQPKSWNDFVWLFAEAELRLKNAYQNGSTLNNTLPKEVKITISKIIDFPSQEEVKKMAEIISAQGPTIQQLHWYIAERINIYNQAKPKRFSN